MNKGTKLYNTVEGSIFDELSIWKVIDTNKKKPAIIHMDGSVSTIIPFQPLNVNSYTEDDFEEMFTKIKKVIEGLDSEEITVQFIMMREKARVDLNKVKDLATYLQPRAKYLLDLADQNKLFENSYYLSIHCKNKNEKLKKDGVFKTLVDRYKNRNNVLHNQNENMLNIPDRLQKLFETTNAFTQMLLDIKSGFTLLQTKQEFYDIITKFTRPNKSKTSNIEIDRNDELNGSPRQMLFSGVKAKINKENFTLDDYFHKVYTLDRAPRKLIFGKSIQVVDSLPFEIIYSLSFRKMSHKETLRTFKWKMMEARMLAGQNKDAIIEDLTLEANKERIHNSYSDFAYGDSAGIQASINLVFRVHESFMDKRCREEKISRQELIRRFDQLLYKQIFVSFGDSEWSSEENLGWFVFNKIIPGMSTIYSQELKSIVLISRDLPYFISFYDNKMAGVAHNGVNHFIDMKDSVIPFDLTNQRLRAWNYSISGQTGSGKSVLMNAILTMQLAETKPVICILDVGGDQGSYMKFMSLTQGTQINLSGAIKPSIQLFDLKPELSIPTRKKLETLTEFFMEENVNGKSKCEKEEMELRMRAFYNKILSEGSEKMSQKRAHGNIFEETTSMKWKEFLNPLLVEDLKKVDHFDEYIEQRLIQNRTLADERNIPQWLSSKYDKDNIVIEPYLPVLILKAGECRPSQKSTNLIMSILEVILSSTVEEMNAWSLFDRDDIEGYVIRLFEYIGATKGKYPKMSDFVKFLEEGDDRGAVLDFSKPGSRKLVSKLTNWTVNGTYPMFDQETTVNLDNDIILADLKGVEDDPKLQMVYTLLISQLFSHKMYFTRDRRKFIVRDEAWSLMKNKSARLYFEEDLRTARKNGFATIAISQKPTDYMKPDPELGKAIIGNMQVNIFCYFDRTTAPDVAAYYGLTGEVADVLKKLGPQDEPQPDGTFKKTYAKFVMLVEDQVYILKNALHPFEYQLYSSSPVDNAILRYYKDVTKQIKNLEECMFYVADGKHKGDEGLIQFLENSGFADKARDLKKSKK